MELGQRYLELMLRFRRRAPTLVESYVGPAELAARVEAEPVLDEPQLVEQAAELRAAVERLQVDPDRAAWLAAQLRGVEAACELLGGGGVGYRTLVQRCYEVQAVEVDDAQFEHAHEVITRGLPGPGTPRERFAAWMATQLVSGEQLVAGLRALAAEFRARTHALWELPDGETVEFELARDKPWAGNADYRGGFRTVVQINDELPIMGWRMVELVAHEAYPGHHTEQVCKDVNLLRGQNRSELAVWAYPTSQALMAEGIAMLAPEMLLGPDIEDVSAQILRPLGIEYDTAGSAAVRRARELLLPIRANLALRLDEGRVDRPGMTAYARRWLLEDDAFVERLVDNLCQRDWPPYESCYPEGLRLCRRFVAGDHKRFGRLLCEQLTPAAVASCDDPARPRSR
ncbi:MAG: hypothetical protein ACRDPM_02060 [Solirubrobacteraceae bacterium]